MLNRAGTTFRKLDRRGEGGSAMKEGDGVDGGTARLIKRPVVEYPGRGAGGVRGSRNGTRRLADGNSRAVVNGFWRWPFPRRPWLSGRCS